MFFPNPKPPDQLDIQEAEEQEPIVGSVHIHLIFHTKFCTDLQYP